MLAGLHYARHFFNRIIKFNYMLSNFEGRVEKMVCIGKGGIKYDLTAKPLAAGGEGEIYDIMEQPNLVAKIYKSGKTSIEKERKLVKMVNEPPDRSVLSQIAWPKDVLYNDGQFVGFIMPKMNINEDLNVIYEYGSAAKYPHMPWGNRLIIAQNLCAVLNCVNAAGHICGDFNPKNISVNPKTGHIMFLDTDSYHIHDGSDTYRCDVGIPEYLPAEVQVKMRGGGTLATAILPTFSQDTDNFALAIHIFQLLMNGVHPFACAIIPSQASIVAPQPSDNIIKGDFPFMQKIHSIKIPAYAPKITILPQYVQDLFERAFVDGHHNPSSRPSPIEWHGVLQNLRNEIKACANVSHHQYYEALSSCPWCEVNNNFAQSFKPKVMLTQTTIQNPSYTQASKVKAPVTQTQASIQAQTSYHNRYSGGTHYSSSKNRWQRLPIAAKTAVIAVSVGIVIFWFGMQYGWFSGNNGATINNASAVLQHLEQVYVSLEAEGMPIAQYNGFIAPIDRNVPAEAIHIKSENELASIGGPQSEDKYFVLDNDIDLKSEWIPIEDFRGTFDGQGYSINNLFVQNVGYAGLFGQLGGSGTVTIKNVGVNIGRRGVSAVNIAGGLVAYGHNAKANIINCYVTGNVSVRGSFLSSAGGLIGKIYRFSITDCYTIATVNAFTNDDTNVYAGGLVGDMSSTYSQNRISSCFSAGKIEAEGDRDVYAGGLVGGGYNGSCDITDSFATGDVHATLTRGFVVFAGGLVGGYGHPTSITNCHVTGDITVNVSSSSSDSLGVGGGLIGRLSYESKITNCSAQGNVTINGAYRHVSRAGGLVGTAVTHVPVNPWENVSADDSSQIDITNSYRYRTQDISRFDRRGSSIGGATNQIGELKD